jgi:hypothetical protein
MLLPAAALGGTLVLLTGFRLLYFGYPLPGPYYAKIEPRRDGVFVSDVGSTNGTYLNGVRVTAPTALVPGDVVRIGETELRYER